MDIDDGYVLWTGIWKGAILSDLNIVSCLYTDLQRVALGNSKGELPL